jgi:hypothetical protein
MASKANSLGFARAMFGIVCIALAVLLYLYCVAHLQPDLAPKSVSAQTNVSTVHGDRLVRSMTEYRAATPGYFVQIIEITGSDDFAALSVSICPAHSGDLCIADEISAAREKIDSSWSPVYCGGAPCHDQSTNWKLIQWALDNVYKPEFIVDKLVSGLEAANVERLTQRKSLTDSPARYSFFYLVPDVVERFCVGVNCIWDSENEAYER